MWRSTLILLTVLASGCAKKIDGDFCDIAQPMYFDTAATINWLSNNDIGLLRDIVAYNEIAAKCG